MTMDIERFETAIPFQGHYGHAQPQMQPTSSNLSNESDRARVPIWRVTVDNRQPRTEPAF